MEHLPDYEKYRERTGRGYLWYLIDKMKLERQTKKEVSNGNPNNS